MPDSGLFFAISGPAGSGKTTLCDELLHAEPRTRRLVTCTSRAPRPGEQDGVDYHFLTAAQFEDGLKAGEFFEHALVHGRHYGSRRGDVLALWEKGFDVLVSIDVQGAATLREKAAGDARFAGRLATLFIVPPSIDELRARLRERSQDAPGEIERRLQTALAEVPRWREFDYAFTSGSRADDFLRTHAIYLAEKSRVR